MKLNHLVACCLIAGVIGVAGCGMGAGNDAKEQENALMEPREDAEADSADAAKEAGTENPEATEVTEENTEVLEESATDITEAEDTADAENADSSEAGDSETSENPNGTTIDFEYDYSADIKADVDAAVTSASSLQDELTKIDDVEKKYVEMLKDGYTQYEMNVASSWYYTIWDTELNSLWSRFSEIADAQTKEKVLADQRAWISMKDEAVEEMLGPSEQNGSMYPLLKYSLLEEMTKTRSYFIADEIAKIKGESFTLPEAPYKYGTFIDNQGTDSVYSSLFTHAGWEDDNVAKISLYRLGEIEGTFKENSDGTLAFTSDDESVKGTITINGWDGATFEVTEVNGASFLTIGDKFEFPFVF